MVRPSKARKGGWKPQKHLSWQDVKDVHWLTSDQQFNVCVSIMPESGNDSQRKQAVFRVTDRIGQNLARHGKDHIGVTTFEKGGKNDADLHGHHLTRMDKAGREWLEKQAKTNPTIYVDHNRTAQARNKAAGYATKQRLPGNPDWEKRNGHRYELGVKAVPGKKISYTKKAALLLAEHHQRHTVQDTRPGRALKVSGQIEMFPGLGELATKLADFRGGKISPVLACRMENQRQRLGLSQWQLAAMAGISQPQYANAIAGRFGLSPQAARGIRNALQGLPNTMALAA